MLFRSDRTGTAGHGRAADDGGADGVQLKAGALAGRDIGEGGGVGHGCQTGEQAADHIGEDVPFQHVHPGKLQGFLVGADGDGIASDAGLVEDQGHDDGPEQSQGACSD